MPLKSNRRRFEIPLTEGEYASLVAEAERQGVKYTELVRRALAECVPGFGDDPMPPMGWFMSDRLESESEE